MRRFLTALISVLLASTAVLAAPTSVGALPSGVAATPGGTGVLDVTWTASGRSGVVDYKVQADQLGSEVTSVIVTAPATSAQLTGLGNGQSYTIIVTARDAGQATLGTASVVATTSPVAPSNVVVTIGTETSTSVPVSWTANNGGGTNVYDVSISPADPDAPAQIGLTGNSTSFTGLSPSTSYTVTVVARNGVLPNASGTAPAVTTAPPVVAPSNVVVTIGTETSTSVPVSWTANNGGGTNVYDVSISPADPDAPAQIGLTGNSTSFTGLSPSTSYTVTVVARNGVLPNASGTAPAVTTAPPVVAPSNVVVTIGTETSTSVPVSWTANNGGGTNVYDVSISPADADAPAQIGLTGRSTSFTGLSPSTSYTVTVVARNGVLPNASGTAPAVTTGAAGGGAEWCRRLP